MEERTIDLGSIYKYAFDQFRKYASFIIGITVTYVVLAVVPRVYFYLSMPAEATSETQFLSLFLTLVQVYLGLGFTRIMLLLTDDLHTEITDLFNGLRMFISYFVATFLYGIAVGLGLLLLVVPGIFVAIRLQFYPYYIIELGDNAFTALYRSYTDTENLTLELFLFGITVVAANLAGALFLGIGVIFTYPLTTLASVVIYKGLLEGASHLPTRKYIPGNQEARNKQDL